uniref:phosphoribosylaminoimidazolesuccinocarboxamide synthase n=1 Tax=Pundamilia nyererei TaxID=303518 RepID=A0A3B4H3F9_9CICH
MTTVMILKIGQKLNEGKTKQIFELVDQPGLVLVQSKDQITAGNAVSKDQMEGKAAVANKTTSCVFQLLQESGEVFISAQGFGNNRLHQRLIQ